MAFTLVGFHENIDAATLDYITALADPHITVSGDNITVPTLSQIMAALAIGVNITQARLESPSLREIALLDIVPVLREDVPGKHAHTENLAGTYTQNATTADARCAQPELFLQDFFDRPIPLVVSEVLQAKIAEDGAVTRNTVLVWLGDGIDPVPAGKLLQVRTTWSTTLTAYAWTNASLTFDQTLPAGRYAIIGAHAYSDNLLGYRFVIPGLWQRPGGVGVGDQYAPTPSRFRRGKAGSWGEFEHNLPPTVDLLAAAADTSGVIYLDLVQVRAGPA